MKLFKLRSKVRRADSCVIQSGIVPVNLHEISNYKTNKFHIHILRKIQLLEGNHVAIFLGNRSVQWISVETERANSKLSIFHGQGRLDHRHSANEQLADGLQASQWCRKSSIQSRIINSKQDLLSFVRLGGKRKATIRISRSIEFRNKNK